MKYLKLFLFSFTALVACNQAGGPAKQQPEGINATVDTLLNNWHKDASEANFDQYMALMDSISVFIGTDANENWTKSQFAAFCKPHFEKGKAWDFKTLERNIYVSKTAEFVWFDELLDTWMGVCRGSGVLEKSNGCWKIKQYVLSVSIPNEDVRAVIEAKMETDSIFMVRIKK